jgi:hypothetical protein
MFFYLNPKKSQFLNYFILTLVVILNYRCSNRYAIVRSSTSVKREFKNQSEQENYWAEELFKKYYKVEHYKKYNDQIILSDNNYLYKNAVITVGQDTELRAILNKRIFYPDIMAKAFKYRPKIKITINKDSLIARRKKDTLKFGYITPKIDSLRITAFEEIKFLEKSPTQRRFRLWLFRKGFANPTVYFMELTNKNATAETDLLSFIDGAKLTFFQEGWIII